MKVRLAKTAGFCMGVRLAMEKVLAEANKAQGAIYTYGPLIHNRQVMELLESKGVTAVDDVGGIREGTLVIRAHGIPPDAHEALKATGLRVINATCPRVARVQAIIRSHTRKGCAAVIVGDRDHAEVIGLQGYAEGQSYVIDSVHDVDDLPRDQEMVVVAQTTQDARIFEEIMRAIRERNPNATVFDTICDATHNRQDEVRSMAGQVDGMVVVGGYHSGNTKRLAQVSREVGLPTFHVETEKELDRQALSTLGSVGVTAGASTPNWMIREVVRGLERIQSRKDTRTGQWIRLALRFLIFSNLWVALAVFSLTHAAILLAGRPPDLLHPTLATLYIWAMRVLNRFLDRGASTYNEPDRAHFYKTHRTVLIVCGIGAVALALALAWQLGVAVLASVAGVSALGIAYSIPIMPVRRRERWRTAKIKDIPGSKTFAESLAWGVVIAVIPLLENGSAPWPSTGIAFFFVLALVNVRSGLFDIFQAQGDLIVGVETLPITIGEKRTLNLLKGILAGVGLLLLGGGIAGLVTPFAYMLLVVVLSFSMTLGVYEKRWMYPGLRLEAVVEGNLFLAGLLGLLWQAVS
ncbi:MAG: 4-hydroxy-3-methylbut-2-enyl diphosphate reductase [Desulfobacteraceae bacterium]